MLAHVILAIEKVPLQKEVSRLLAQEDVDVEVVTGENLTWNHVVRATGDVAIVSQSLIPSPAPDTIKILRDMPDSPNVIVMADHEDPVEQATFLAAGCEAVVFAGLAPEQMRSVLTTILRRVREQEERGRGLVARRSTAQARLSDFISHSPAMREFMAIVSRVVPSDASLLILGETGVGKERLARAIHTEGPRAAGPFVPINCAALPETLLESELFGHEEGAFTGASRTRRGIFELAHGGTVFLDEVGEIPIHLQAKLLRTLQEHEIQRVGSERAIRIDVRVMAASNRNLEAEVAEGRFRSDLYYRLGVVTLVLPPLRNRREDIAPLAESYVDYFQPRIGRKVSSIRPDAMQALLAYSWPGNVRELMNVIERAMLLCSGTEITLADLPESISGLRGAAETPPPAAPGPAGFTTIPESFLLQPWREVRRTIMESAERAYLAGLLRLTAGRVGETARRAGMCPRSLFDKMRRLGLRKEDFRMAQPRELATTDAQGKTGEA